MTFAKSKEVPTMPFGPNNLHDLQFSTEKQIMDRKSARIAPRDFAIPVAAMANADGEYLLPAVLKKR